MMTKTVEQPITEATEITSQGSPEVSDAMVSMLALAWHVPTNGIDLWDLIQEAIQNDGKPRARGLFEHLASKPTEEVDVSNLKPTLNALLALPEDVARANSAFPFHQEGRKLFVALPEPMDANVLQTISLASDCFVQPYHADKEALDVAIAAAYANLKDAPLAEPVTVPAERREFAAYLSGDTTNLPGLSREQEIRLAQAVEEGLTWAKEVLVRANIPLVIAIAKKQVNHDLTIVELTTAGMRGLEKAVEKFDYRRGFLFSTYATHWIRQFLQKAIKDQGTTTRTPHSTADRQAGLRHAMDFWETRKRSSNEDIETPLGSLPTEQESDNAMPPLSKEEIHLAQAWENGEEWAKEILVNAHLPHALAIAKEKYGDRGLSLAEMTEESTRALELAVETFDYRRGFRFATFATHHIHRAFKKALDTRAYAIELRVPYVNLQIHKPEPEALSTLTPEFARAHRVLPIKRDKNRLWVAMEEPNNTALVDELRMRSKCLVQPMLADLKELKEAIATAYGSLQPPPPPYRPTAVSAPAPEPSDETTRLLRQALTEMRGLRDELNALRAEVAELRSERSKTVLRPTSARLFPLSLDATTRRRDS